MNSEKSISDLLLEAGYRHERTARTTNDYRHRIVRVSDGEVIGHMDAHEAATFLSALSKANAA